MNDIAQYNLAKVPQVDWENYGKQTIAPPDALDAGGKPIVYFGVAEAATEQEPVDGYLSYLVDPIVLVGGATGNGYQIRFTRVNARPYGSGSPAGPKKGNPNKLADFLRSTGLQAKPINEDQFRACVQQVVNLKRQFGFTIDWYAKDKQTGEVVKGFNAFPVGPDGKRKWVLHAGDVINTLDAKGQPTGATTVLKAETVFANAELKYFRDPKGTK